MFMYVNLEAQNPHLLGTQLISSVIEKLNIMLPKRGGNFHIISKNRGLIFNFFLSFFFVLFLQYHFSSWLSTMCFSTLTRVSLTLNMISSDNCCKILYVCCYCNLM